MSRLDPAMLLSTLHVSAARQLGLDGPRTVAVLELVTAEQQTEALS